MGFQGGDCDEMGEGGQAGRARRADEQGLRNQRRNWPGCGVCGIGREACEHDGGEGARNLAAPAGELGTEALRSAVETFLCGISGDAQGAGNLADAE